ncbi:LrgB family protein [uncultured Alphaproteobacteria bacterium]|uniref:LrgB family protein n=1 Tax=uncultured Alphaproteobacteria bacterium TaxID=91750 RepID=A0A212J9H4_9PROT|nr:LrgB family protein [uncultured Alphaproteobacteria bacterium]
MPSVETLVNGAIWSLATIAAYLVARALHRRVNHWALSPLIVAPAILVAAALAAKVGYDPYIAGTHWLMLALGPATVAFALPIYEHRATIRRLWPVLLVGVVVGSGIAMLSAWGLAAAFDLSESLRLSLLPRSMSMPFALIVAEDVGGVPDLTAVFVVLTAVVGVAVGEILLKWLPLTSALARGSLFGMGAHGAGVAKATEIGGEEGSIAGLVMVLSGVVNVLAAPLIVLLIR